MSTSPPATAAQLNQISSQAIGAAIAIHRRLGPGMLESAYFACLRFELSQRGLTFVADTPMPFQYRGTTIDAGYRPDFVVERKVILEVKAVETLAPYAFRQLMTYLRLSGCPLGLLMNFGAPLMVDGIERVVHNFPEE